MEIESRPANWSVRITPRRGMFQLPIKEIWRYRDLLYLLVRRDFVTFYKQTILGPLWFVIQPLLTTAMFVLVFGKIAQLSTDGLPQVLFYLAGVTCWGYFSECLNKTATTFVDNADLFNKVYFPRLISPLSVVCSNLMRFGVQFVLFLAVAAFYFAHGQIHPNLAALLLPYLVLLMACLGLGIGLIFTSLTTKYRDLRFLLQFGVQLLMYATPIIYPVSTIPAGNLQLLIRSNPITPIVEAFRYGFLGAGELTAGGILYSTLASLAILMTGLIMFNRTETTFIDTV
jgi:lipopolysaccharide transport system permease protein